MLDGLGLERPVVVANSLGSLWASWLAIERPNRVGALVHVGCPAIVLDTSAPLLMRLLSVRPLGRLMMKVQPPSERQVKQLGKMVHEHPLPPEIARLILATERLHHFEDTFLAMLNRLVRLRGNRPEVALTADDLGRIRVPTLLVFANDDPMGAASVGRRVASAMVDAELHLVEGGHAPWLHHADQIALRLSPFLGLILEASPTTLRDDAGLQEFVESVVSRMEDPIDPDLARSFVIATSSDDVTPELLDQFVEELVKVPARVWQAMFAGLLQYDDMAELTRITAPTLLLWGDSDALVSRDMQGQLVIRIPGAKLLVYPGVGHTPRWDDPSRFTNDVAAFAHQLLRRGS